MYRSMVAALGAVVLLGAALSPTGAEDDFPIVGTYTENVPCTGADAAAPRVTIGLKEINSSVFGLCTILERKRQGSSIAVHVECKGPGGAVMLGDVKFVIKDDKTLDFSDQDNTYKAVLYKCPQ